MTLVHNRVRANSRGRGHPADGSNPLLVRHFFALVFGSRSIDGGWDTSGQLVTHCAG